MPDEIAANNERAPTPASWKPGQSGNPYGRPKKRKDLQSRCVKAVNKIVIAKWINEVETGGPFWVECSKLLAAYGFGKPSQTVINQGSMQIQVVNPYEIQH